MVGSNDSFRSRLFSLLAIGMAVTCCHWNALRGSEAGASPNAKGIEFFEKKIRPVLATECYSCHGEDPKSIEGGLILTNSDGVRRGGESGPVIVPGYPKESLLIQAIRHESKTLRMPPEKKLPDSVIRDFAEWVRLGAPDPREVQSDAETSTDRVRSGDPSVHRHWAYQPVSSPELPSVQGKIHPSARLDSFILARLDEGGIDPVEPADKRTLIRRATFDLLGLPPTPEEVEAFVEDQAPGAFARLLDRLLASPYYGERWGRHWLDVVRYADSNGLDENYPFLDAYRYRDYVVRAFGADKPYDVFLTEQLAGDLMPESGSEEERFERLTATGFLVLGAKVLAEPDSLKMELDIIDEQLDVLGKAFLAHSFGCARCHDHKFDPIPSRDYYALAGIFKSTRTMVHHIREAEWMERPLASAEAIERRQAYDDALKAARDRTRKFVAKTNEKLRRKWISQIADYLLAAEELETAQTRDPEVKPEDLATTRGLVPAIVEGWKGYLQASRRSREPVFKVWHAFVDLKRSSTVSSGEAVEALSRRLLKQMDAGTLAASQLTLGILVAQPNSLGDVASGYQDLFERFSREAREDRFDEKGEQQEREKEDPEGTKRRVLRKELLRVIRNDDNPFGLTEEFSSDKLKEIYPEEERQELTALLSQLEEIQKSAPPALPRAMAVTEREPTDLPIHYRGDYLNVSKETIPRGVWKIAAPELQAPAIPKDRSGRLELARWLTDPHHPLTARVMVNRIWQGHFGIGLVASPSNFGLRGATPTHPKLLDDLAQEFIRSGWSIKRMHRNMMLSEAYRRSSRHKESSFAADPDNRLLWRMTRRRLEAEAVRDAILCMGDQLDRTFGGRIFESTHRAYVRTADVRKAYETNRRALYIPLIRNSIYPMFSSFDYTDPTVPLPRRPATTVAHQALFLMNSPLVLCASKEFARTLLRVRQKGDGYYIREAYLKAYGRPPTDLELKDSVEFLKKARASIPDSENRENSENPPDLLVWSQFCQTILASNEFLYLN